MKTSKSIAVIGAALLMFAGASAQAQVITWGAAQTITTDTDVATNGTLLYADYVGGPATDTINTVTFTSFNGDPNGAGFTHFDAAINYGSGVFGAPDPSTGYTGSPNYSTLLEGAFYKSGGETDPGQSLTLSGLTAGDTYEFQAFYEDSRRGPADGYSVTLTGTIGGIDAGGSVTLLPATTNGTYHGGPLAAGQYVTGTFVATGSTELIDIGATATPQINAFQVRDLGIEAAPEPSTYALMGLGALALLVISRRRRTA